MSIGIIPSALGMGGDILVGITDKEKYRGPNPMIHLTIANTGNVAYKRTLRVVLTNSNSGAEREVQTFETTLPKGESQDIWWVSKVKVRSLFTFNPYEFKFYDDKTGKYMGRSNEFLVTTSVISERIEDTI